jgi:hypothetical protein
LSGPLTDDRIVAAEDELVIPTVPESKPEDPEDVSWALSTAEAMWTRGDHAEGIKWVRRAAEAASEAEADTRALELAKAAADLAGLVARRSMSDHPPPSSDKEAGKSTTQSPTSNAPSTARSATPSPMSRPPAPIAAPPAAASSKPMSKPPPAAKTRSAPPIPLPSRASQRPEPPRAPQAAAAPRGPAPGRGVLANRTADQDKKKSRRRSRDNLEAEAREAGVLELASSPDLVEEKPYDPMNVARALDSDATIVGTVDQIKERARSTEEWDRSPTQNTTGEPMFEEPDDAAARMTSVGAPPAPRAPISTLHDPKIQTSQAIRVVVWRDAHGVHIAPAGTVVTALTIDAVLVSLEPSTDLTAWLSARAK